MSIDTFRSIKQLKNIFPDIKRDLSFDGIDEEGNPKFVDIGRTLLHFSGSLKLHGTNAGVGIGANDELFCLSRSRKITPQSDNMGFAFFIETARDNWLSVFAELRKKFSGEIVLFGEWCGQGIQSGVGISSIGKKIFAVFKCRVNGEWVDIRELGINYPENAYSIYEFGEWNVVIDTDIPQIASNEITKFTFEVEEECPGAKFFGKSGIGEGIVWTLYKVTDSDGNVITKIDNKDYWFKSKGKKHSESKVNSVNPIDIEKVNSVLEFVSLVVTRARVLNVMGKMGSNPSRKVTGDFIKDFFADVCKEEMETMVKSGLAPRDVQSAVGTAARKIFFEEIDRL